MVEAALLVAAEEYPELDIEHETSRVHLIAAEAARRVSSLGNFFARLDGIRKFLYEDLGFKGDRDHYQDPRNCFLNDVLDRKLGIPLTLSILHLEAARAAGFQGRGVGLPGHFVLRLEHEDRHLIVDPYHDGQVVGPDECRDLVRVTTGRPWLFREELLAGTDDRGVLGRMLLNLKHVYIGVKDYPRALSAVQRLLLVRPGDSVEIRDRGLIRAEMGLAHDAIPDLETYLTRSPDAPDAETVRTRLVWLRSSLSELN